MAEIKMDISEYEAMKENKALLENSLKKERELQEQIKKITDEKTKMLEESSKRVVKIIKTEKREHLLNKRPDKNYVYRSFLDTIGVNWRALPPIPDYINTDLLADVFFEKVTTFSHPIVETTTHGLDEIKNEIREDLLSKIDSDTKEKLKYADETIIKNNELIVKINELEVHSENVVKHNKSLLTQIEHLQSLLDCSITENKKIISENSNLKKIGEDVTKLVNDKYTIFNFKSKIKKLKVFIGNNFNIKK